MKAWGKGKACENMLVAIAVRDQGLGVKGTWAAVEHAYRFCLASSSGARFDIGREPIP